MVEPVKSFAQKYFALLFSEQLKGKIETVIISISIFGFLTHLVLIWLHHVEVISLHSFSEDLFNDPISAVYTPFSFILVYEVYLLIYYLPKSITFYIGKQYEIVSLIVIRRIFKDISNLKLDADWFDYSYNRQLLFDAVGITVVFFLTYLFYSLSEKKANISKPEELKNFINAKKMTSIFLLPTLVIMACYSFGNWLYELILLHKEDLLLIQDVNQIFYHDFFTLLILVDVLLLLISLRYTSNFGQLMRNAGFIISTVLIKLSFGISGPLNISLIIGAVLFGVLILWVYTRYLTLDTPYQKTD